MWGTTDGRVVERCCQYAADPVCRWIEVIEPVPPENRELGVWADDAVEEREHDEEEGKDV